MDQGIKAAKKQYNKWKRRARQGLKPTSLIGLGSSKSRKRAASDNPSLKVSLLEEIDEVTSISKKSKVSTVTGFQPYQNK